MYYLCRIRWWIQHNLDALETIVNYAMDKDIPYFAVNVPNDTCLGCGYTGEIMMFVLCAAAAIFNICVE